MAAPYSLRFRADLKQWSVRFRVDGHRVEKKIPGVTTQRQRPEANRKAREIYAAYVAGELKRGRADRPPPRSVSAGEGDLVELTTAWLESLAVRGVTVTLYRKYAKLWVAQWAEVEELTEATLNLYAQVRLKKVKGKTVRNELSGLNTFLTWCQASGVLESLPRMPKVSLAEGASSPKGHRVSAPELTDAEMWAIIEQLPERSDRGGWPIKARAIVAYTTALRPATLDKLSVPRHYAPGAKTLLITDDIDKEGFGREVPLAPAARAALDAVCPDVGLIFGAHNLGRYVPAAARKVLPAHKAKVFCMQHFRSASITHMLERSSNLPGVQYLVGHKHASTTSRYNRPTSRAASEVLDAVFGGEKRGRRKKKASKS